MAKVLFAGSALGSAVLPLMLFHQLQLIVCALVAARYGRAADAADAESAGGPAR
jgi:sodium/bile acid cotransporter 7